MAKEQNNQPQQEQDINQLLKVRREKLANLQAAGKDPFKITKYDVTHHSTDIKDHFEEMEGKQVSIAGRLMAKRVMGKASFCNVQDLPGTVDRSGIGCLYGGIPCLQEEKALAHPADHRLGRAWNSHLLKDTPCSVPVGSEKGLIVICPCRRRWPIQ